MVEACAILNCVEVNRAHVVVLLLLLAALGHPVSAASAAGGGDTDRDAVTEEATA
jgi:hypothetical protein